MSGELYISNVKDLLSRIEATQMPAIRKAAEQCADSIEVGRAVHVFGSGHSVIPVLDIFPRYGSFVGFHPMMDPRLMWFNVDGPGGAQELLWLERQEGYIANFMLSAALDAQDTMLVFSHGGLNAAPVEVALLAKGRGLAVIAVTSMANHHVAKPAHSSGKRLADIADFIIDNCVDGEDASVSVEGYKEKVGALSTVAFVTIATALVAEVGRDLAARSYPLSIFVSANVPGVGPDHNRKVFEQYSSFVHRLVEPTGSH